MPADTADRDARVDAALAEYLAAAGRAFDRPAWLARYADVAAELADFLDDQALFEGAVSPLVVPTPGPQTTPPAADAHTHTFAGDGTRTGGCPAGGGSATTSCSKRSPAAAWESCTRPGR